MLLRVLGALLVVWVAFIVIGAVFKLVLALAVIGGVLALGAAAYTAIKHKSRPPLR